MRVTRHFARRFRLLKLLRGSLGLGALYNLAAAGALLAIPGLSERLGGSPARHEGAILWMAALMLAMLALLYGMAAHDPRRYSGIILVAIGGRLAGGLVLGAWAAARPELGGLWALAAAEGALGLTHGVTWIPLRI